MAKILNHITDLHLLDDAEVAQFAAELPAIVASLRLAATAAKEQGSTLAQAFPNITFVPELKDATVYRAGAKTVQVSHQDILAADQAQTAAAQVIQKADTLSKATQSERELSFLKSIQDGNVLSCKMLLDHGVSPNTRQPARCPGSEAAIYLGGLNTALHIAAACGQTEICDLLLSRGADINGRNANGYTPLYAATRDNKRTTGLYLVSRGADTVYFGDPEGGSNQFQNQCPLRCGSTDFSGMSMHTAAIRLGDVGRLNALLDDPNQRSDAAFIKDLISSAKSAKRPEIAAFLQARTAAHQIEAIRTQSGPRP